MPLLTRLALPIACTVLWACGLAGPAHADRWTFCVGAGAGLGYQLNGHPFATQFDPCWLVRGGARRLIGRRWALQFAAGDLHDSRSERLTSIPEVTVLGARQTVDFVPLSAGVRFYPASGRPPATRAFFELAPTLCVATWREHASWDDHFSVPGTHQERSVRATRGLAALSAGCGIEWVLTPRVRPEFAVRYLLSNNPIRLHVTDGGLWEVSGLRQLSVEMALGWAP